MAYFPLTKAERELCFVAPSAQFARVRELRAKMHSPRCVLPAPVLVEARKERVPACAPTAKPITKKYEPNGDFSSLIIETEFEGRSLSRLDFSQIDTLPVMVNAMDYFAHKTGDRPIKRGDDAKIFARLIESHVCLEPGALLVRRRTPFYMIPRRFYCQKMRMYSGMSLPIIGKTIDLDHTSVLYHIRCEEVRLDHAYMGAIESNQYRSRIKGFYGNDSAPKIAGILPPKWAAFEDSIISEMLETGLTVADMSVLFDGFRSHGALKRRITNLRQEGVI